MYLAMRKVNDILPIALLLSFLTHSFDQRIFDLLLYYILDRSLNIAQGAQTQTVRVQRGRPTAISTKNPQARLNRSSGAQTKPRGYSEGDMPIDPENNVYLRLRFQRFRYARYKFICPTPYGGGSYSVMNFLYRILNRVFAISRNPAYIRRAIPMFRQTPFYNDQRWSRLWGFGRPVLFSRLHPTMYGLCFVSNLNGSEIAMYIPGNSMQDKRPCVREIGTQYPTFVLVRKYYCPFYNPPCP